MELSKVLECGDQIMDFNLIWQQKQLCQQIQQYLIVIQRILKDCLILLPWYNFFPIIVTRC